MLPTVNIGLSIKVIYYKGWDRKQNIDFIQVYIASKLGILHNVSSVIGSLETEFCSATMR